MYELTITAKFSAAHRLKNYKGACEKLHGHNWRVEVQVTSESLNPIGIAIDFKILKKITYDLLNKWDHRCLNEISPFKRINPSSENIAKTVFEVLSKRINKNDIKVSKVTVWESDDASATYIPSP